MQDILWATLYRTVEPILMRWPGKKLRENALNHTMEHIHYEDENTRYICIGPVNKVSLVKLYCGSSRAGHQKRIWRDVTVEGENSVLYLSVIKIIIF